MILRFEEKDDFKTNVEQFLAHMENEDPEMGAILRANMGSLQSATDEASRKTARVSLNLSVMAELDSLLDKSLGNSRPRQQSSIRGIWKFFR